MIHYQYGKNTQGMLVKIEDINENNSSDKYQCLSCNNPLRPRAIKSDKVRPHFYHPNINNENKCNLESYIHKLAKSLFLEHLQAKKPLSINWEENQKCDNPFSDPRCIKKVKREVNLITHYTSYTLEKRDSNGYIPDLLLCNDKNEKLYIEFAYTHFSTKEKRECGEKIIEISINSEKDIENILKNGIINSGRNIEFINFNLNSSTFFNCEGACSKHKPSIKNRYIIKQPNIIPPKNEKPFPNKDATGEIKVGSLFVPLTCHTCKIEHYGKIATIEVLIVGDEDIFFNALLNQKDTLHEYASFSITRREKVFGKEKNYYEHFCPKCNRAIGKRKEPPLNYRERKKLGDDEKWLEQID
jgi:hypothetical protein